MKQLAIGLVVGLLSGGTFGAVFLGSLFNEEKKSSELLTSIEKPKTELKQSFNQEGQIQSQKYFELLHEHDDLQESLKTTRKNIRGLEEDKQVLVKELNEHKKQLEVLKESSDSTAFDPRKASGVVDNDLPKELTAEELTALKLKAKTLVQGVEASIQSQDKSKLLESMDLLKKMGVHAAEEFFEAYALVQQVGNPWGDDNSLGLTMPEYASLMSAELRDYALKDPQGSIPESARISAVYGLPWDGTKSTEEKLSLFSHVLETSDSSGLSSAVISNMGQIGDARALSPLLGFVQDTDQDSSLRAQAVYEMGKLAQNDKQWDQIARLEYDPDEEVAKAAKNIRFRQNPSVTGYYISSIIPDTQAEYAGMQAGDVIVRYNGEAIENSTSLANAKRNALGLEAFSVEVYRNGSYLTFTLSPGMIGINGDFVVKK